MTLRQKTLLIISLAITTLTVVLFLSANTILLGGFSRVENQEMSLNLDRASNAILVEMASVAHLVEDWSIEEVQFPAGFRSPSLFQAQQLNLIALFDADRKLIDGALFHKNTKTFSPLPESFLPRLHSENVLAIPSLPGKPARGLFMLPDGPVLVAFHPVAEGKTKQGLRGYLMLGRFLDDSVLARISETTRLSLQVEPYRTRGLSPDFSLAVQNLSEKGAAWIAPLDETRIAAYSVLTDLSGSPGLILRVTSPRTGFLQGQVTVQYFSVLLIIFVLLFGIISLFALEKTILSRLSQLNQQVFAVAKRNEPSLRVQVPGQDELSRLADSINKMLSSLELVQNELKESDAATRALIEGLPDFLLRIDRKGTILDFRSSRDRIAATPANLLAGNSIEDVYPASLAEKILAASNQAFEANLTQHFEHEMTTGHHTTHLEVRITPINENEAIAILRDFTELRQLEKSLQFYNLRDTLTGLYNRTYWDEKAASLSSWDDCPVGIILCEIDEINVIRDSLGIEHANSLLVATAGALRASLPVDSVLARTGTDQLAILLMAPTEQELEKFCRKIRQEVDRSGKNEVQFQFGVSLGSSMGIPAETDLQEIFQIAQSRLHREKLSHSQASRNKLFRSLQTALETRDFITHQHAARLWALGKALAKEAGLPDKRLRAFKLLTQFHDIGKIGVPDELLFKQKTLTPSEKKHMKLHVEIGHRIAQAIPDLFPIADILLKHHEWWNGEGYPLGLKEEEIPLECRIFSIVDAYDAMTNDRPGRKAMSAKEAAAELRRCAGSQFDPVLIKKFLLLLGEES